MLISRILLCVAAGVAVCIATPMMLFAWVGNFTPAQTFTAFGIAGCLFALILSVAATVRSFIRG